jgi:hypothetical protein
MRRRRIAPQANESASFDLSNRPAAVDPFEVAALELERRASPNTFDPDMHPCAPEGSVHLRDTPDGRGIGVYATRHIGAGWVVTEYAGETRDERRMCGLTTHAIHVPATRTCIDGACLCERLAREGSYAWVLKPPAGIGAFINSTWDAHTGSKNRHKTNVQMNFTGVGKCFVTSTRALTPGDELLWFYAIKPS